jgi:hypothetical protein
MRYSVDVHVLLDTTPMKQEEEEEEEEEEEDDVIRDSGAQWLSFMGTQT